MVCLSCHIQCMIFVYKHETGTAISEMCFLCFSPSSPSWRTRKQDFFCFGWGNWCVFAHAPLWFYIVQYISWTKSGRCSCEMPLSGLQYSLRWQAGQSKTLCSDVDAGHSAQSQCVGHLIVLRPVAGFPAVLLFFVSSCFLHQKWDFQLLSASSLYQSRPLWSPSSRWWMLLWRAPGKCPVCVYEHVCVCVCEHAHLLVFVCMSVWLQNIKESLSRGATTKDSSNSLGY